MIDIKKVLVFIISVFVFAGLASSVIAKSDNSNGVGNNGSKNVKKSPTPTTVVNNSGYLRNSEKRLEQAETRVRNTAAKEAIREASESAATAEANIDESFKEMSGRPGFLKFIMGPDYKNAGEIRSEIVHIRNQISKLTRTAAKLTGADKISVELAINSLKTELTEIEVKLSDALKGFSLFGWLSKLLNGFNAPEAETSPSPSASASASPVGTATAEPTVLPTATPEETILPSATP